jgi:hypothetical protein
VPAASVGFNLKGEPEPPPGPAYRTLLMAQTPQYETRARAVARIIGERDIKNVCGELNTVVHHNHDFVGGLNQNAFGAAYYASALIHLIRGGADLEMRWTATAHDDAYGIMTMEGEPTAACLGKELFAQHVRYGDWVSFPVRDTKQPDIDASVARAGGGADEGRISGVIVNTSDRPQTISVADWERELSGCSEVLRLDAGTGDKVVREPFNGLVRLDGYGLAVVSTQPSGAIATSRPLRRR